MSVQPKADHDNISDPDGCEQKTELVHKYVLAVNEYNRSANFLQARLGQLLKSGYVRIREWIEQCRERADQARFDLEQHTSDHGC